MWSAVVVEADPVTDGACRVLDAVEALAVDALLLQRPDHAFDRAVLLWAVRGDELLLQPVASDQRGVAPRGEDQAVVGPQKELLRHLSERAEPTDQGMFQGAGGSGGLAGSRQMPAQKLAGVAVDHKGQCGPAVAARPDPTQVGRPAFVRCGRHGGHRLDAGAHADRAFANLPAFDLEDALHGVLVKTQKPGNRAVAEGWLLLDHGLDWIGKARIDLRGGLGRLVIDRAPRHAEPRAEFRQRHRDPIGQKALMERPDQLFGATLEPMARSPLTPSRSMRAASFFLARSSSMASP